MYVCMYAQVLPLTKDQEEQADTHLRAFAAGRGVPLEPHPAAGGGWGSTT